MDLDRGGKRAVETPVKRGTMVTHEANVDSPARIGSVRRNPFSPTMNRLLKEIRNEIVDKKKEYTKGYIAGQKKGYTDGWRAGLDAIRDPFKKRKPYYCMVCDKALNPGTTSGIHLDCRKSTKKGTDGI
jgi:hypothetical protein